MGLTSGNQIKAQRSIAVLTMVVAVAVLTLKLWAYKETGSQAVFSDALESIVNILTGLVLFIVVTISNKPADDDHPYGHGKIEYFSAALEGGLISFTGILVIIQTVHAVLSGPDLRNLELGQNLILITVVINLALGFFLLRVGKRMKSIAMTASGHHVLSDVWTSVAVFASLFLVQKLGYKFLDTAVALCTACYLIYTGSKLLALSAKGLMDAEDTSVLGNILNLFTKHWVPGIIRIHHTRVMRSGSYHHIDAHVVVPEFWDVKKAHEHTNDFEVTFLKDYGHDGEIHFHVDPCRQAYCRVCDLMDCPIRREKFVEKIPFTIEELRSPLEPKEFLVSRA